DNADATPCPGCRFTRHRPDPLRRDCGDELDHRHVPPALRTEHLRMPGAIQNAVPDALHGIDSVRGNRNPRFDAGDLYPGHFALDHAPACLSGWYYVATEMHLIGFHAISVWLSSMPATLLSALRRLPNMAMPSAATLRLTAWPRAPGRRGGTSPSIAFALPITSATCATRAP